MPDPFLTAAQEAFTLAFEEMDACLKGLSTEDLDWRPDVSHVNSLAVLATHALGSTHSWLCVAMGQDLPARDRDAEFGAIVRDAAGFAEAMQRQQADCLAPLGAGALLPWEARRATHPRPDPDADAEVTGAWALMHALEHLREHLGQMLLTRQLLAKR